MKKNETWEALKPDPITFEMIESEGKRQESGLELIASENYVSPAVLRAQGSVLTNKYAEGYPQKRYYGGCVYVDEIEKTAIERACQLFQAEAANVQPHSGSQANMAAYLSLLKPGSKILGMSLAHGGHLTHGSPVNFSGRLYEVISYGLDPTTERLNYNTIEDLVKKEKPAMIIAGASAYPRTIDFKTMGEISKRASIPLVVDMAHIAGLVATGLHPTPIPHATITTTTTHKTLRGPRGGMVLGSKDQIASINKQIFPGIQGGPLMHVIAAKAVSFHEALQPTFKTYQQKVIENAQALAASLTSLGFRLVTGGTDNHLMLVDLTGFQGDSVSGKDAEIWLDQAHITVNKNTIPNEKRSPFVTSGIRIGTPAITTRGLSVTHMKQLGMWIKQALESKGDTQKLSQIRAEVEALCATFPVYTFSI